MRRSILHFYILIALGLLPVVLCFAERHGGNIRDINDQPVAYVFIYDKTRNHWIVSDERGEFLLPDNFLRGDSLVFTRIGYQPRSIVLNDSRLPIPVVLSFAPVDLDSVTVSARIFPVNNKDINLRQVERSADLGSIEHRRLFTNIPGLYLKSYGGPTGVSTLSIDGSPATHTKVIIAGFDVTSAQNGQIDLSQLPPAFVANILYSPDQSGSNSFENSEGSINIEATTGKTGLSFATGSFGKTGLNANLDLRKANWNSNLLLGYNSYRGDYRVSWRGDHFKRENNQFRQQYCNWQAGYILKSRAFVRLLSFYSQQERGVAGLVWNPSPDAYRRDALGLLGLKTGWTSTNGYSYLQLMHRYSREKYVNPTIAIDSRHIVTTDQVIFSTSQDFRILNFDFTSDLKSDRLRSKQAGNHSRLSWINVLAVPWNFSLKYELRPWIKFDYSPALYQKMTWGSRLSYNGKNILRTISGNYGYYYAYPTFNDLYWQPGGNPDLKPDETTKYEIDAALQFGKYISLLFDGYYKKDKNLIQWTPVQSYWQPSNLAHAVRQGWKFVLNWSLPLWPVDGFLQGAFNQSRNLTNGDNYGKALRYTPGQSYGAGLNIKYWRFVSRTTAEYVGSRIAMYNWPEDVLLPAYVVFNTNLAYNTNTRIGTFIIVCGIDNLTDESFESMQGYPEPGRAVTGAIEYSFK